MTDSGTAEAVIFVVDATDRPRLGLMLDEMERISRDPQLHNVPILILANKQDLRKPITLFDLSHRLNLPELLNGRRWKLMVSLDTSQCREHPS
jgi:signal recognition particle receptor subunit beta